MFEQLEMKRIGQIKTTIDSIAIVRGDDETCPDIGTKVVDERLEEMGHVVDIIGPISRPYILIKTKMHDESIVGKRLYSR
jgi:rRNA processing protein Gar1